MNFYPQLMERFESNLRSTVPIMLPISKEQWAEYKESPIYRICEKRYAVAYEQIAAWEAKTEDEKLEQWADNPFNPEAISYAGRKPVVQTWIYVTDDNMIAATALCPNGMYEWEFIETIIVPRQNSVEFKGQHAIYNLTDLGIGWYKAWFVDDTVPKFTADFSFWMSQNCYEALRSELGMTYLSTLE